MPEDNLASETLPEKPVLPSQNEHTSATNLASENSISESLWRAGEKVVGKFGFTVKRGRGRPANCKGCNQPETRCTCSKPAEAASIAPAVAVAPAVNPAHGALFTRSIASAVRGILGFAKSLVRKKAKQAGIDEKFTETALAGCEVEPEVLSDFNEALGIVMEKYRVQTQYAPEIALGVAAARMAAPYALLLQTFNAEIKRRRELEGGAK